MPNYQGNAVMNFTDSETPYTRIIEHKHFEFGTQEKTVITREYPAKWKKGDEPYYPMNDEKNNELYAKYRELLELIREYQPDALIFIQGIMHVSYEKSSSDSCRNNTVIYQRNCAISTLANGRDIFYIDMNPYVCDESGDLYDDLSGDGIHLKAFAYENWDRSLMENAIVIQNGASH